MSGLPVTPHEPANVRLARFLGYSDVQSIGVRGGVEKWVGIPPREHDADCDRICTAACQLRQTSEPYQHIPNFYSDWSATGPLIERFQIELTRSYDWCADSYLLQGFYYGATPIAAIAALLLALAEREQEKRA